MDDLSCDKVFSFLSKVPNAAVRPSPVNPALTALLLDTQGVWTLPSWIWRFITTVNSV